MWSPPSQPNGIVAYLVYQVSSTNNTADLLRYNGSNTNVVVTGLEEFQNYTFFVTAYNVKYNLEGPPSVKVTVQTATTSRLYYLDNCY